MLMTTKLLPVLTLLLWGLPAAAQSNLGELLDKGAVRLSAEEFKEEVAQHVLVGRTPTAEGTLEIVYGAGGQLAGIGKTQDGNALSMSMPIGGEWAIDDSGRICTTMWIGSGSSIGSTAAGGLVQMLILPRRCQVWFKYADAYFASDSDSDRHARVLRRVLKK